MTTHTPAHETLTAAHLAQAIAICEPRMISGVISYELTYQGTVVGEIRQSTTSTDHIVLLDVNLHTSSNSKQVFSGAFQECVEWVTGSQPLATMDSQAKTEEKQMNIREKAAQVSEKLAADELQRQKDLLYTDDQFRRNGYGHYDSCPVPPVTTKDSQMTTQAPAIKLSPVQLAANEPSCLDIIQEHVENLPYNSSLIDLVDDLILTIQAYIAADGRDGNKAHDELGHLARKAKVWRIFKVTGQIKNDPRFRTLVEKYEPILTVSGGNERGTVVAVGTTAAEVANAPNPPKGQSKGTKGTKVSKEKAPKKTKETKALPALPIITDLAALESLDRKALQSAMSITNLHKVTGVKGNGKTVDILKALAKHLLGIDDYTPTAKPTVAKGGSKGKDEVSLEIPQGLCWNEVKDMKYKDLQYLCKIFRSNGLYSGNLAGKDINKAHFLKSAAAAMRALGHDIQPLQVTPAATDSIPTLERTGKRYELACQATDLIALAA